MKNACHMLMNLGIGKRSVYEEDFEKRFLSESASFYRVFFCVILTTIYNFSMFQILSYRGMARPCCYR